MEMGAGASPAMATIALANARSTEALRRPDAAKQAAGAIVSLGGQRCREWLFASPDQNE